MGATGSPNTRLTASPAAVVLRWSTTPVTRIDLPDTRIAHACGIVRISAEPNERFLDGSLCQTGRLTESGVSLADTAVGFDAFDAAEAPSIVVYVEFSWSAFPFNPLNISTGFVVVSFVCFGFLAYGLTNTRFMDRC